MHRIEILEDKKVRIYSVDNNMYACPVCFYPIFKLTKKGKKVKCGFCKNKIKLENLKRVELNAYIY